MIHDQSRLLKKSMDVPVQLNRVRSSPRFQAVKKPDYDQLPWQEIASSEHTAAFFATRVKHFYVARI
ncbi:hypothetical protein X731_31905 [Mesorhizobium sp. L2C054A000]|nr:hypothetical protein X731_31905 [Mesorhizobium sp. L2C054A000]